MMRSFLSRALVPAALAAGALSLLGLAPGCGGAETAPGGSSGSSGTGGGAVLACNAEIAGSGAPVTTWSHGYEMYVSAIATDRDSSVFIAGSAYGPPLDLGLGSIDVEDGGADFVARFTPEGKILWNRSWNDVATPSLAADACGNVFVARAPLKCPKQGTGPCKKILSITRLDSEGHDVWQRLIAADPQLTVSRVVLDASGNMIVLGKFIGPLDLGKGPILPLIAPEDAFLASLDGATGETLWGVAIAADGAVGIGAAPSGEVFLTGRLTRVGSVDVMADAAWSTFPLVRLAPSGEVKSFAPTGSSVGFWPTQLIVSPQGDVGAAGSCSMMNGAEIPGCMARFPADGSPAIQQVTGAHPLSNYDGQVAFDAEGNLLMLSESDDPDDTTTPYGDHLFLSKMSPAGALVFSRDWRVPGAIDPGAIHVDPAGGILFAARVDISVDGAIDVGDGPVTPTVLARAAP